MEFVGAHIKDVRNTDQGSLWFSSIFVLVIFTCKRSKKKKNTNVCPELDTLILIQNTVVLCIDQLTSNMFVILNSFRAALKLITTKKGAPRTALYDVCKKKQWPLPEFETTEKKSRLVIVQQQIMLYLTIQLYFVL